MAGKVYGGTYPNGITLSDPGTQETVTVTGTVTNTNSDAIYGTTAFPWTVNNQGSIANSGTSGNGVQLVQGGTVNNQGTAASISGYDQGVLIRGAAGLATNFGVINANGTDGRGILFTAGGKVVNGSAADTAATIAASRNALVIAGASGKVTNFGTLSNGSTHATVVLIDGGSLTNGASASTAALITGPGPGIYAKYASGAVTNFGSIGGSSGILLRDGGTVVNGASGSTAATITGTIHNSVGISGAAGTVTNFGTINATGTSAAVSLAAGGRVINGSAAVTTSLITGTGGTGVAISQGGTVVNFGTIAATNTFVGTGIALNNGGSVANFGTIQNAATNNSAIYLRGGAVTNGRNGGIVGLISAAGTAIVVRGSAGTVNNSGTVQSSSTNVSGIYMAAGGGVTNQTGGMISAFGPAINIRGGAGTVSNAGVVQSLGSFPSAIYMSEGGSVTNQSGALISALGTAVVIHGGPGTVANSGTVQSLGSFFSSVYLQEGGSVTNQTGALISGAGSAINIRGGAGTVSNAGSVQSSSATSIYLSEGGSVANQTGGLISGIGTAINIHGGAGTVDNSGVVQSTGPNFNGVYLQRGGTVTNQNGGVISSGNAAIFIRGRAGTVNNSGTVQSFGTFSDGIYLNTGGTITNAATGRIAGGLNGIHTRSTATTIVNSGRIESTATSGTFGAAAGIYLQGGGSIINNLGGTIAGSSDGIRLFGPNATTVVNRGLISGTIGLNDATLFSPHLTVTNYGTIASTNGTGGTALVLCNGALQNLLIVEAGSTLVGGVNGGGNGIVDFVAAGTAGVANMYGFATVGLGNGVSHSLTLTDANFNLVNFNHMTVVGGDSGNTVDASAVTAGNVIFVGGAGADHFTGGAKSDTFKFSTTTLTGTDTVAGGGGSDDKLVMTSPGTVAATGVTGVEIFQLANGGANTLSLANANFTGISGGFIRVYGGNAGNTVKGVGVTTSSDQLVIYGGAGVDHLIGGSGKDVFVFTPATLNATDTVVGSAGADELLMTAPGTINAGGVNGVENVVLATGGTNTLSLASANFAGVNGSTITVYDGNSGNTVNASALPSVDKIIVHAGTGTDALTGGAGTDVFFAGGKTTMTGGAGANRFTFADIGSNTITDFTASATNELVFSNSGFNLGLGGATSSPQALPASLIGSLTNGSFGSGAQRFAYDQGTGQLLFDADGNGAGASHVVATLTGDPALTASRLFFVT